MRRGLRDIPEAVRARAGAAAAEALGDLPAFSRCARVAAYATLPDEFPSESIVELARARSKPILWPRIAGSQLQFVEAPPKALRPGAFGILEPPVGLPETLREDDLVLVSGLAFDDEGFRLGRGRGFYDRALATGTARKAFRLGVGYAFQWVPRIPRDEWDLAVHAGVTEEGLRDVRRQRT